jgi:hypothetical protein
MGHLSYFPQCVVVYVACDTSFGVVVILLLPLRERKDGWGWKALLAPILRIGEHLMQSHEAHPGMLVQVNDGLWRSEFAGMVGTVEHRWGNPDYPALDVRLEDGRMMLFWFHELDEASEN